MLLTVDTLFALSETKVNWTSAYDISSSGKFYVKRIRMAAAWLFHMARAMFVWRPYDGRTNIARQPCVLCELLYKLFGHHVDIIWWCPGGSLSVGRPTSSHVYPWFRFGLNCSIFFIPHWITSIFGQLLLKFDELLQYVINSVTLPLTFDLLLLKLGQTPKTRP